MKFVLDENFSFRLPPALRAIFDAESRIYEILHLDTDLGWGGLPDQNWLPKLPKNEQIALLTKDFHISRRPHERAAWREAGVITFFFGKGWFHITGAEQASLLIKWWPTIRDTAYQARLGAVYPVPYNSHPRKLDSL